MRFLIAIGLFLLLGACEKTPDLSQQDQFKQLVDQTFIVQHWYFEDYATGETYDLKWSSGENDSIYLHFETDRMIMVAVDRRPNKSYYKWRLWDLQFNEAGQMQIVKDSYLTETVTKIDSHGLDFEGSHQLHQQFQTNSVQFTKMQSMPARVRMLLDN